MTKTISIRDANQGFSTCIREVEAGEDFVVTRNGTPVARIVPAENRRVRTPAQEAAWARLDQFMDAGTDLGGLPDDRDVLHER